MGAMFEEGLQKCRSLVIAGTCCVWPADPGLRKSSQDCFDREIIKLEIFFCCPLPIPDVGFVPYFPKPRFHFCIAVTFAKMMNELENKFGPFLIVIRRISPACVDAADLAPRKVVTIGLGVSGERFRHETD